MPTRTTQTGKFRRALAKVLRFLLVLGMIVGTSVGAVFWLTAPVSARRPRSTLSAMPARTASAPTIAEPVANSARVPESNIALFSEGWIDDSGYDFVRTFALPIKDPNSLEEIRTANASRFERGLADVARQLAALDRRTVNGKVQATRLTILRGLIHMAAGEFAMADAQFAEALTIDPAAPRKLRANIEALRGMAALRRGETENCVACCNAASCIFPLGPDAVHRSPAGASQAVRYFSAYLEKSPEDLGVRWLFNVAHMTLGSYPDGVPKAHLIPLEPFQSGGDIGRFPNVAARVGLDARGECMAGGTIVDDFNGDGLLDVFHSTIDPSRGCSLFLNRGDGTFRDYSAEAQLGAQVGAENCNHADFDNDGDLDVLLLRGAWESPLRPSLLRNDGTGVFTDVTLSAGLISPIASETAGWSDYDGDGDLDLYVAGEYQPRTPDPRNLGKLYRNNSDGTFTDVAASANVLNARFCRGVSWGDYDNDGRPDLYLSNMGFANRLYHNNGDGTFTDVAESAGVTEPIDSYGCWFWDYDNDGRLDLFVAGSNATLSDVIKSHLGLPTSGERPRLYHNEGDGRFVDVARTAGLDRVWLPMGCNFGDLDNDGFLDFYLGTGAPPYSFLIPNILIHNVGGRRFEDITTSSGTGHLQKGHGIAFADYDRDGDLDLFLECGGATPGDKAHEALFENPGHGGRWLTLKLIGTRSNRSALGARVRLTVDGPDGPRSVYRDITPGASFGNNPLTPTIGLGRAGPVADIEIIWPRDAVHQVARGVPLDRAVEITEGREGFRTLEWRPLSRR
jgi:FG-GAP-like repeat/ASPIC and UnbV